MNHMMGEVGASAHIGELVNTAQTYFRVVEIGGHAFTTANELLEFLQERWSTEYDRLTKDSS